jgi:hypothetical protein
LWPNIDVCEWQFGHKKCDVSMPIWAARRLRDAWAPPSFRPSRRRTSAQEPEDAMVSVRFSSPTIGGFAGFCRLGLVLARCDTSIPAPPFAARWNLGRLHQPATRGGVSIPARSGLGADHPSTSEVCPCRNPTLWTRHIIPCLGASTYFRHGAIAAMGISLASSPSGPGRTQTCDLPVRSQVLCSTELQVLGCRTGIKPASPGPHPDALSLSYLHSGSSRFRACDLRLFKPALLPPELQSHEWRRRGSNPRPPACDAGALPT